MLCIYCGVNVCLIFPPIFYRALAISQKDTERSQQSIPLSSQKLPPKSIQFHLCNSCEWHIPICRSNGISHAKNLTWQKIWTGLESFCLLSSVCHIFTDASRTLHFIYVITAWCQGRLNFTVVPNPSVTFSIFFKHY